MPSVAVCGSARAFRSTPQRLQGDTYTVVCAFDTGTANTERWGFASTDEMCIDFVTYWPKIQDESVGLDVDEMLVTSYNNADCSGAPVEVTESLSHQPGYGGGGCREQRERPASLYVCGRDGSPTVVSLWATDLLGPDTSDACSDFTDAVNTTITSSTQCVTWVVGTSTSTHHFECVPQIGSTYVETASGAIAGPEQLGRVFGTPATGSPTTVSTLAPTAPASAVHTISWGNVWVELASITVDVGDAVRWVVDQQGGHNIVSGFSHGSPDGTFSSPWLGDLNDEWSHMFDEAGIFPYYCAPHVWMVGTITVVNAGGSPPPTSAPTPVNHTGTSTATPNLTPTATPTTSNLSTMPTPAPSTAVPTVSPTATPNLTPADKAVYVFAGDLASLDAAAQVGFKAAVRAKAVADTGGTVQSDDISAVELSSGSIVATVRFDGSVTMDDVRGLNGTSATLNVNGATYHGAVTVEPVPSIAESEANSTDPVVVAGVVVGVIGTIALIALVTFELKGRQSCKVAPRLGRRGSVVSLERTISHRLSARRSSTKSVYEAGPSIEHGSLIEAALNEGKGELSVHSINYKHEAITCPAHLSPKAF